jgi:hypothetical protein
MEVSKIQLSNAEIELMQNAEIILTKNRVLEKIKSLLEIVQEKQSAFAERFGLFDTEIFQVSPKISKGENYLGLPYVILDYPRHSTGKSFFFIRTMFWWGNFFSCTLHLAKDSKQRFQRRIADSYPGLKDYYIATSEDEWVHHLKESDYRKIGSFTKEEFEKACKSFGFIKIAYRHSLGDWQTLSSDLFEKWKFLLTACVLVT